MSVLRQKGSQWVRQSGKTIPLTFPFPNQWLFIPNTFHSVVPVSTLRYYPWCPGLVLYIDDGLNFHYPCDSLSSSLMLRELLDQCTTQSPPKTKPDGEPASECPVTQQPIRVAGALWPWKKNKRKKEESERLWPHNKEPLWNGSLVSEIKNRKNSDQKLWLGRLGARVQGVCNSL